MPGRFFSFNIIQQKLPKTIVWRIRKSLIKFIFCFTSSPEDGLNGADIANIASRIYPYGVSKKLSSHRFPRICPRGYLRINYPEQNPGYSGGEIKPKRYVYHRKGSFNPYRFAHCGARRAFFKPGFFLSFMRGSRVR